MGTVEAIGGCERIVKTTVPASYSRHTSRFLRWIAVPGVSHALLTLGEGGTGIRIQALGLVGVVFRFSP